MFLQVMREEAHKISKNSDCRRVFAVAISPTDAIA